MISFNSHYKVVIYSDFLEYYSDFPKKSEAKRGGSEINLLQIIQSVRDGETIQN